jgi:2-iminoacetate synthase
MYPTDTRTLSKGATDFIDDAYLSGLLTAAPDPSAGDAQVMEREQFVLGDVRPLDAVMGELIQDGYLPSFCTACYRLGRTGEHFMEFAIPGFIKRFCTPNALTTLMEYLTDYASPAVAEQGRKLIEAELAGMSDTPEKRKLAERLNRIQESDERDLYV